MVPAPAAAPRATVERKHLVFFYFKGLNFDLWAPELLCIWPVFVIIKVVLVKKGPLKTHVFQYTIGQL